MEVSEKVATVHRSVEIKNIFFFAFFLQRKYPKTDYVYSSTYSPFRRYIKPGIIAMPNMSRRSLDHHQERINEMATNDPTHESFIRRRYQSNYDKFQQNFNTSDHSQDECDEFDYRTTSTYRQRNEEKTSIIRRFFTAIFTFIFTTWHKTCRIFSSEEDYRSVRYTRLNENKGKMSHSSIRVKGFQFHFPHVVV